MQDPYYDVVEVLKMLRPEIYVLKDVDVSFQQLVENDQKKFLKTYHIVAKIGYDYK